MNFKRSVIYKKVKIFYSKPDELRKIRQAFTHLKKTDSKLFSRVLRSLKIIVVYPIGSYYNELFCSTGTWIIDRRLLLDKFYPHQYLSSLLVHELIHLEQYQRGRQPIGVKAEKESYLKQRNYLKKINYTNAVFWLDKQYKTKWWRKMDQDQKSIKIARDVLRSLNLISKSK